MGQWLLVPLWGLFPPWGSAIPNASVAEMGVSTPISAGRTRKITLVRSLQGTDGHRAAPGTAQTPEEDGKEQTAGAGEQRQEGAEGRRLSLLSRQPGKPGGVCCPSRCRLGYTGRSQMPRPAPHTLPRAQLGAQNLEPSASEEGNGPHSQTGTGTSMGQGAQRQCCAALAALREGDCKALV